MALSVGIVGLPNTGKSTLFQALTQKQVDRANYPFCTIEPNLGIIAVPDNRLDALSEIFPREKKISTTIEFVDIAGLIKGASQGEGLGNKFLSHIREVDAVVYVLRGFNRPNIINTQPDIDPWAEKEILDVELSLKDLETLEKRLSSLEKDIKAGQKAALREAAILEKFVQNLKKGRMLVDLEIRDEEKEILDRYQLLSSKPRLYLINASKSELSSEKLALFSGQPYLILDVLTELEAADLSAQERQELDLGPSQLDELIQRSYQLLDLITFFTVGQNEVRAWTLRRGQTAPEAGGVIHTDFQNNFIKAEVINWQQLVEAGSFSVARQRGLVRTEGKDYQVQDGDVIEIKAGA